MDFSTANITVSSEVTTGSLTLCPDMPTAYTVYFVILSINIMVGLPLNIWVMVLLTRSKKGCTVSDVFALNLAILEVVIFCYVQIWLYNYYILKNVIMLTVMNYFEGFFWFGRPLFKCSICVERYLAVVHPIVYFKYKVLRCRLACVVFIWLIMTSIGVLLVHDNQYNVITAISVTVLAVETFCSFSILRALRQAQPGGKERQEMNLMKRRAFNTVLVIQIMTMINYFPVIILKMLRLFNSSLYNTCVITPVWMCFTEIGSFVHPLVYLFRPGRLPCVKLSQGRNL